MGLFDRIKKLFSPSTPIPVPQIPKAIEIIDSNVVVSYPVLVRRVIQAKRVKR